MPVTLSFAFERLASPLTQSSMLFSGIEAGPLVSGSCMKLEAEGKLTIVSRVPGSLWVGKMEVWVKAFRLIIPPFFHFLAALAALQNMTKQPGFLVASRDNEDGFACHIIRRNIPQKRVAKPGLLTRISSTYQTNCI